MTTTATAPSLAGQTGSAPAEPRSREVDVDPEVWDVVDVWSRDSFPASDPPANW